jgi:hypothetical protein
VSYGDHIFRTEKVLRTNNQAGVSKFLNIQILRKRKATQKNHQDYSTIVDAAFVAWLIFQ